MRSEEFAIEIYKSCAKNLLSLGYKCADNILIYFEKIKNSDYLAYTEEDTNQNGLFSIYFSIMFLDERVPIKAFEAVMYHELLHTVKGFMKFQHTGPWLIAAKKVEQAYPGMIITKQWRDKIGIPEEVFLDTYYQNKARFKICCKNCGGIIYRTKSTNFTKNPSLYRCSRCGGQFKETENL